MKWLKKLYSEPKLENFGASVRMLADETGYIDLKHTEPASRVMWVGPYYEQIHRTKKLWVVAKWSFIKFAHSTTWTALSESEAVKWYVAQRQPLPPELAGKIEIL
jgi:pantoate kinase